jgi:hypothetical protein
MANGEKLLVIHCENAKTVIVKFCDDKTYPFIAHIGNLRKGKYKNPYTRSIHGVGYIGCGDFSSTKDAKAYKSWIGMIRRVFDDYEQARRPSTTDLSMEFSWECFQSFAYWATQQKGYNIEGFELDKDLLEQGNNVYGPQYCCFIPREINTALPKRNASESRVYVSERNGDILYQAHSRDYKTKIRIAVRGSFEECYKWKRRSTQNLLLCLVEKYKNDLDDKVIERLSNFYKENK